MAELMTCAKQMQQHKNLLNTVQSLFTITDQMTNLNRHNEHLCDVKKMTHTFLAVKNKAVMFV